MGDTRIGPSSPSNIQTTDIDQPVETPSDVEVKPEVSTLEEPAVAANTEEAMNKAGTETKGYLDTGGEYLKERLSEQLGSPLMDDSDPQAELQHMLQEVDPNQAEPNAPGQMTQGILDRGMMRAQFAAPIALPNATKGLVNIKLTDDQKTAKTEFEKSPAWAKLTDGQKNQILSKISGKDLQGQIDKINARLGEIETVSKRGAWKELTPAQQQKISDQVLKARDDAALKTELTKIGDKFDSIEELSKTPGWSSLNADQKAKLTDPVLTLSGDKLKTNLAHAHEQLDSIEKLSKNPAWSLLSPDQKTKLTNTALTLSGDKLKTHLTQTQAKLDSIEKLSQSPVWNALSADQKAKLTDPVLTLSGDKLKTHLSQSQEKLDSIASFTKQPSWKQLQPADQQKITDHILKTPQDKLKLTTDNVQATIDFVGTLRSNNVDPGKTLDKLLSLESTKGDYFQNPQKSFGIMKEALKQAQTQINAAKDKKTVATDIKDMLNFSLDRAYQPGSNSATPEIKGDIAQRFLAKYKNDPADFSATRTSLNNTPNALLVAHPLITNGLGVEIHGSATNVDLTNVNNVPAGLKTKYEHAIGNLLRREGPMDNINFWDNQIISLGVRQWSSYGGDLVPLLKDYKNAVGEDKFKEMLPGITFNDNQVLFNGKALTPAVDPRNGKPLPGQDVRSLLENLKQSEIIELSSMFNKLGKDAGFQKIELQNLTNRINNVLGSSVGSHKIGDYIKGDRGIGQLVSYEAFSGGMVQEAFNKSVTDLAKDLGLSGTPSRQELLDALKVKLEGKPDPKDPKKMAIEPDKAFIEKLEQKYKGIVDKLKTDSGREAFLENRLIEDYRDNFLTKLDQTHPGNRARFSARFASTDKYYESLK